MKNFKKMAITLGVIAPVMVFSQTAPTGAPPANNVNSQARAAWYRGGNSLINGANNIFGTMAGFNSPIYTVTNGVNRTKLNGNVTYPVNGYTGARNGNMLIGNDGPLLSGAGNIYTAKGAFSLLHLNGVGSQVQEFGYRPWMQTGITLTGNSDLSYFGLRKLSTIASQEDITETVILWSDNSNAVAGPDKLVFRFSGYGGSDGATVNANRLSPTDLDALHVAQFSGNGLMGLGNTFGTNATGMTAANYVEPQSLLHMSYDWRAGTVNKAYGFGQITYRNDGSSIPGTGETANDGLRWGIDNTVFNQGGVPHLNAYLRWQENTPFIVQTDFGITPGGASNGERVRFTSVGSIVSTQGSGYGGLTTPANRTRIAISADGANPITRPLSLLHLGYNTGAVALTPGTDGWRSWMDIGMFTSNGTDNVYLGLKDEGGLLGDRQDAVLSWGDNQVSGFPPGNGPDNFRMIFASTTAQSGGGTAPATGLDGLEGMRMTPTATKGIYTGIGGDPTANRYGPLGTSINPTATLEVNSWNPSTTPGGSSGLRFTNLNTSSPSIGNPGTGVLSVDANGDVIYVTGSSNSSIGNYCNAPQNNLTGNYEIRMNNQNFYFSNNDALGKNHVGIGYNCIDPLQGKLSVYQHHLATVGTSTTGIYAHNDDVANIQGLNYNGVYGSADGVQTINKTLNRGGYFTAKNSDYTMGVMGEINDVNQVNGNAYAGNFEATTGATNNFAVKAMAFALPTNNQNVGVMAEAMNSDNQNFGGFFRTYGFIGQTSTNIGVIGAAAPLTVPITVPAQANIGVYGNAARNPTGQLNGFAGFFDGDVWINGDVSGAAFYTIPSDSNFKNNIQNQQNANTILNQLKPKTFYFDTLNNYAIDFKGTLQHGLIAQDVEMVLPELVYNKMKSAMVDSAGNIINPSVSYKSLDYSSLISILIAGHQEQGIIIDSLQSSNDSLHAQVDEINDRLTQLENCLSGILPFLCQLSQQAIQTNTPETQQAIRSQLSVILDNKETIILDQNVPNPFAEQTTINFSIPESVKKAQIQFYDGLGSLIKTVDVKERGLGSLTVFGSDLSSGTYLYKLVADGILVATKKMVKE